MIGIIMALDRRPKKKNKKMRFEKKGQYMRGWNNTLHAKRSRQLRQKGERA